MQDLSGKFEKVVIDTPPSLNLSDSLVLSKYTDAVILVIKSGVVTKEVGRRIKERFDSIGSKIIGAVVNFAQMEKHSYYRYRYYHRHYKDYYASEDEFAPVGKEEKL